MRFWVKDKNKKGGCGLHSSILWHITNYSKLNLTVENYSFFVWLSVSFDRKSLSQTFFKMFFFCFPKFSSSIIFPRSTSAIQNQTANIISSRKRPKMTICLTSLLDHSEKLSVETPGMNETSQANHKIRFFRKFERFFKFFPFVLFSCLLFLMFPIWNLYFFQNRKFKLLFKETFSWLSVDSHLLLNKGSSSVVQHSEFWEPGLIQAPYLW